MSEYKGQETVPCIICGEPTPMLGTQLCNRCWELKNRIEMDKELAAKILVNVYKSNNLHEGDEAVSFFHGFLEGQTQARARVFKAIEDAAAIAETVDVLEDFVQTFKTKLNTEAGSNQYDTLSVKNLIKEIEKFKVSEVVEGRYLSSIFLREVDWEQLKQKFETLSGLPVPSVEIDGKSKFQTPFADVSILQIEVDLDSFWKEIHAYRERWNSYPKEIVVRIPKGQILFAGIPIRFRS
jgi:hypothetical protein